MFFRRVMRGYHVLLRRYLPRPRPPRLGPVLLRNITESHIRVALPDILGGADVRIRLYLFAVLYIGLLVSVLRVEAQTTQELSYDDGSAEFYNSGGPGCYNAVRFSLPTGWSAANLLTARFYIAQNPNQFRVHILASDKTTPLTASFTTTPTSTGWFDIDLTGLGIILGGDFYLAIEFMGAVGYPYIGADTTSPFTGRSWCYYPPPGLGWVQASAPTNYMVRAVVQYRSIIQAETAGFVEDFTVIDDWAITTAGGGSVSKSSTQFVSPPSGLMTVSPATSSVAFATSRSMTIDFTKDYKMSLYFKTLSTNVEWIFVLYNRHVWLVVHNLCLYWWTPGGAGGVGNIVTLSADTWIFIQVFVHPDLGEYEVFVNNVPKAWANFAYSRADSFLTLGDTGNTVGYGTGCYDDVLVKGYMVDVEWIDYFTDGTLSDLPNRWETSVGGSGAPVFEVTSAQYKSPPYGLHVRSIPLIPGASSWAFGSTHEIMLDYSKDYIVMFDFRLAGTANNGIYALNNFAVILGIDGVGLVWYDVVGGHRVMDLAPGMWYTIECDVHPASRQYDIFVDLAYKATANFGFTYTSRRLLLGDNDLGPGCYGEFLADNFCMFGYSLFYSKVLSAPSGKAYVINPDYRGVKAPGVGYAALSDWTASGVIVGMMRYPPQNLCTDSDGVWCSSSNGQPRTSVIPGGSTIIMFGGRGVNAGVYYYEQVGTGADTAPVYCDVNGTHYNFKRSGTTPPVTLSSMLVSDVQGGHRDQFLIEIFEDANRRLIFIVYGFSWRATWAAALWIKFFQWPHCIGVWNHAYIIVQWEDNGNGIVEAPGVDGYWVVNAGPSP